MNNFPNKRVLLIGSNTTTMYLGTVLARQHPDFTFDIICTPEFISTEPNLHIKICKSVISFPLNYDDPTDTGNMNDARINSLTSELLDTIIGTQGDYDLIIAPGLDFQRWGGLNSARYSQISTPILCPNFSSSALEFSKLFAKEVCKEAGIPTPSYQILDKNNIMEELAELKLPIVLKMDRQFSFMGFGAWVFKSDSYKQIVPTLLTYASLDRFQRYYVEDFVQGTEVSAHFLCNGQDWVFMGAARDYKKLYDGDLGMNTAGLGSYAPVEYFTDEAKQAVFSYVDKLMNYLVSMGIYYNGILYIGVMIDESGVPQVLEFNTRPGNPEFLSILNTIEHDNLLENLLASATSQPMTEFRPNNKSCSVAVVKHKNYDNQFKKDSAVPTFEDAPEEIECVSASRLFTKFNLAGLCLATAPTRQEASDKIYNYLSKKDLKDYSVRKDIGYLK